MNKILVTGVFCFLFFLSGLSQPSRKTIIENRIKAVTSIAFDRGGKKKDEIKTYYSIIGDDSVKFINGKMAFTFQPIRNKNRIIQLRRINQEGIKDEWHLYKYYSDSSYSIEMKSRDAGTIRFDKFTSRHDGIMTIFHSTDTMLYKYNSLGKIYKIIQVEAGRHIEIANIELDSTGSIAKVNFGKGLEVGTLIYKYNKKGLIEEVKQYSKEDSREEYMGSNEFIYEFQHL